MSSTDPEAPDAGLDLERVRETFDSSTDFTVGIEEEFAILDPETLELAHRYPELSEAAQADPELAAAVRGELIDTEIEIRSGRGETFAEAAERQRERRRRLFALADARGAALASVGTHPWADYLDQRIIDTEHYSLLRDELRWVVQRNNTWSLHVHVGVRGADRAVAVTDRMRERLPILLAASANSPFLDGHDTGLHSVRTEIFTRTFPRCGVHEPFGGWREYADFVSLLAQTSSIVEATQLWWSVRPHHAFGTVEVRICDAQTGGDESTELAALMAACVAQCAIDHDEGRGDALMGQREIEENLWRAIRHGMDGEMIDFEKRETVPTRAVLEQCVAWTAPARAQMGIGEISLPDENGAQRSLREQGEGASIPEIYRGAVDCTRATFAPQQVPAVDD
ncbi:glutamate--cysteine ligase [soil metagenome]